MRQIKYINSSKKFDRKKSYLISSMIYVHYVMIVFIDSILNMF